MKKILFLLGVLFSVTLPSVVCAAAGEKVTDIFTDIEPGAWYVEPAQHVYDRGVIEGLDKEHFGPDEDVSRAQFSVMLYRMAGKPETSYTNRFPDVKDGLFYTDAVMWASKDDVKIVTGYTDGPEKGMFGPDRPISREQIAVMIHRFAKYMGYELAEAPEPAGFTDKNSISGFAKEAVSWIADEGIITGRDQTTLAPLENATRAEIATIIFRYDAWAHQHSRVMKLNNGYKFCFQENEDYTVGIEIRDGENEAVFCNTAPVELDVLESDTKNSDRVLNGYEKVTYDSGKWNGKARVTTAQGSVLEISDTYEKRGEGLRMERGVKVVSRAGTDQGYASVWGVSTARSGLGSEDCEYFIPALLYKDTANLSGNMLFARLPGKGQETLAKETRTGLPMVMMREKEGGSVVSLGHIPDGIGDSAAEEKQYASVRCDADCRYGSVGIGNTEGPGVMFRYPFAETPYSYTTGQNGQRCYHPLEAGEGQKFTLYLYAEHAGDYNAAMSSCYQKHFQDLNPAVARIDMDEMYDTAQKDMLDYVQEKGSGIGLPFAVYVDDGGIFIDGSGTEAVNFQMGFIGMQIPLAYQMMRYGELKDDPDAWEKGVSIVNFWSSRCRTDSGVVKVWFDNYDFRPYPPFLRIMTDGMEGMLDAWMLAEASGDASADTDAWLDTVQSYADFLVNRQNSDGSYYRAYDYSGNAFTDANTDGLIGDANTYGDSRMNSAVPIRFLIRMYEAFQDERYLNAALRAGDYVLKELYPQGKYVGGTTDNPNTVDKEAGMYAMYAYSALYSATGEEKYLEAMKQAAAYTFSWTYTYKFETANPKNLKAGIPAAMGRNDGLSFIAAGHSGVDNMIAYMYYEYFKLYVWTGEPVYAQMAEFLQNNSRQTMDLDGEYGYARRSFMIEATGLADMVFGTAGDRGIWLPWITCANIEPAANMEDTFGTKDVGMAMQRTAEQLLRQLDSYGAGGKK